MQEQTLRAVEALDLALVGDSVFFENVDGRFGTISVSDLLSGRLTLIVLRSEDSETFANAQQLIDAGWAVD